MWTDPWENVGTTAVRSAPVTMIARSTRPTACATTDGGPPRLAYIPALDGLRGLAVAAVVAFHVGHLEGGYLGVDLFFVLSGYLITSLLLAEGSGAERIGLVHFWGRRARRLLPALGLMLIGVAVYARFAAAASELHRIRWDGLATLLYVANWREVAARADYWSMFSAPSPLNHTWSLAIEEQFYLVWPLVFVGLVAWARRRRPSRKRLATGALVTSLVLGAASLVASTMLVQSSGWNRVYFGTDTRAFAVLVGAAVAAAGARFGNVPGGPRRQLLEGAGLVAAIALGIAWFTLPGASPVLRHGGLALCSVAAAVVIAAVTQPRDGPLASILQWKPLRRLGLISYGVYLYHWPIIVWLDAERVHVGALALIALQIGVTLGLATVSYLVVEQPIRHGRGWPRRVNVTVPAVGFATVAVVVFAGTIGYRPLSAPVIDGPTTTVAPSADGARIMVVGDSVADFVASEGIIRLRADPQPTVLNLAVPGCSEPPTELIRYTDGTVSDAFTAHCDKDWTAAARAFKPDYVLFTTVGAAAAQYHHQGRWLPPCSAGYRAWIEARLHELARRFARDDATLVVATTVPQDRRGRAAGANDAYLDANACWNDALRNAVATSPVDIELVDLAEQFCADGRSCRWETAEGSIFREDGSHFRGRAAQIVARVILEQLQIDASIPE